jgi:glycosyltransferase involved in cell wall biosynthesis
MAQAAGFECVFFPIQAKGKLSKAWGYLQALIQTVTTLKRERPAVVWVQLPQVPALWAALLYRALYCPRAKIVADCHNAQLRAPWSRFPFALWSLNRADVILVHNEAMYEQASVIGWPMEKVHVLEDVPPVLTDVKPIGLARSQIDAPKPWVVFPGSFAADEPIAEVMEAARLAPELTFIITGRPERAARNGHDVSQLPSNMRLPGFLSIDVFDDLLREADVVLGLTREEGIQLSVCNEALGFRRPLVTSDTAILRQLFSEAAVMVSTSDPRSIADGCREALTNHEHRSELSGLLAIQRMKAWDFAQFSKVNACLAS